MALKKWTTEEDKFLEENWGKLPPSEIAEKLDRTESSVRNRVFKLGIKYILWTDKEIEYLQDKWGVNSIESIANNLNRTIEAVTIKARKIGLGNSLYSLDGITLKTLAKELKVSPRTVEIWVKKKNLPIKSKILVKEKRVRYITYDDFWKWAEEHKSLIDFSRVDDYFLGKTPDWFKEQKRIDKTNYEKRRKRLWSQEDLDRLKSLVESQKYTMSEISNIINRTESSIKHKLRELDIKLRPLTTDKQKTAWTKEEEDILVQLYEEGYGMHYIANKLDRAETSIRYKVEQLNLNTNRYK